MNAWYVAAAILPAGLLGPLWVAARRPPLDGIVGMQVAAVELVVLAAFMLGRALRAIHSGRLSDYVALLCAGAALFGGAFAMALQ